MIVDPTLFNLNYDQALEKIGGFSLFQWYVVIVLTCNFMTGGMIVYGLPFLEKLPQYECFDKNTNIWDSCQREHICDGKLSYPSQWKIDYESDKSYKNWVDPLKLNLTCEDDKKIGFIASNYFLGFAISCAIIPRIADKVGRKSLLFGSMVA